MTFDFFFLVNNVKLTLEELNYLEKCLSPVLNHVFDKATVEEWLGTYLDPLTKQLCEVREKGDQGIDQSSPPENPDMPGLEYEATYGHPPVYY